MSKYKANGKGSYAVCEMCGGQVEVREAQAISDPKTAYAVVRGLSKMKREHLVGLYLDAQNQLLAREEISVGSLNTTHTHPREIFKPAIDHGAMGVILAHNHPSGSLEVSQEDQDFTMAIRKAADILGIGLYDHLIVSPRGLVSMRERGLM